MRTLVKTAPNPRRPAILDPARRQAIAAVIALVALLLILALALLVSPERVVLADKVIWVFLGVVFLATYTPLLKVVEAQPCGPAFLLTAGMFTIYGIARYAGPESGPSFRVSGLPDDEFILPYSAYVAVFGAILTYPYWNRSKGNWIRALLGGLILLGFLALLSFTLLSQFYPVGPTSVLDPSPLPPLFMMFAEYGCVALICRAVNVYEPTSRIALRALPLVFLILWARFHFAPLPEGDE